MKSSADGTAITSSYFAQRYFDITDNPMMYGKLDVEEFMVGNIKIVLSVYSPNKVHTAASQKETVFKMMQAQKEYEQCNGTIWILDERHHELYV